MPDRDREDPSLFLEDILGALERILMFTSDMTFLTFNVI